MRVAILIAFACLLVAVYVVGNRHAINSKVELELTADQGTTRLTLRPERWPVSPGCGCYDPSFGRMPWYGMAIPSRGFDLSIASEQSGSVESRLWALTAIAPDQHVIDWFGVPTHSLAMRVSVRVHGKMRRVFDGRTLHMVLWTDKPVGVQQTSKYPYAALLPAWDGTTTFDSEAGARPDCCGSVNVTSTAPATPALGKDVGAHDAQRGPMIDAIGPRLEFVLQDTHNLRLWAGLEEVQGVSDASEVQIRLSTPYSLRLIPHPVQKDWEVDMPGNWQRLQRLAAADARLRKDLRRGPRGQRRFVLDEALPAYSVRMRRTAVPSRPEWEDFARRSASRDAVAPFLGANAWDKQVIITTMYGLPPVTTTPEIGVFGRVTDFTSDAVRGQAIVDSTSSPIARNQQLHFTSDGGLDAGKYRFTPLASAGVQTEAATLDGLGKVWVDGKPITRIWWLPWLLGAIAAAIVSVSVEGVLAWVRRARPPQATNEPPTRDVDS